MGSGREGLADNGVREFEITRVISDVLNTTNEGCVGHFFPHCRERERKGGGGGEKMKKLEGDRKCVFQKKVRYIGGKNKRKKRDRMGGGSHRMGYQGPWQAPYTL